MSDAPNNVEAVSQAPVDADSAPVDADSAPVDADSAPEVKDDSAPKWDGEFDPERAARLVANLREEIKEYKSKLSEAQSRISEFERAQMSEQERIVAEAEDARKALAQTARELAMLRHKLPAGAEKWLTGSTPEEIDAQAKDLAGLFGVSAQKSDAPDVPHMLPVPGNGAEPSEVRQLTRDEVSRMSPAELMEAYRAGRLRDIGGK